MGSASILRLFLDFTGVSYDLTAGSYNERVRLIMICVPTSLCLYWNFFHHQHHINLIPQIPLSHHFVVVSSCHYRRVCQHLQYYIYYIYVCNLYICCCTKMLFIHVTSYVLTFYVWWSLLRSPSNDRIPTPYVLHHHQYLWVFIFLCSLVYCSLKAFHCLDFTNFV